MRSKTQVIYEALREDIARIKYGAEDVILEKQIAQRFGVSKTPAREALGMLVQDGYLRKYPRLGYMLNEVSSSRYYDLTFLRFTLEQGVVAAIIAGCTDEEIESLYEYCKDMDVAYKDFADVNLRFHLAMADLTGNKDLADAVRSAFYKIVRLPSKKLYQRDGADPHKDHRRLVAILLRRDLDGAVKMLREDCRRDDDIDLWF